jgi:3-oxoacyl-[acyl-carrier protein] reductase
VNQLNGRVAVVTGVSRGIGIGAAIARRLAADGAALVLTGWTAHDAEQPWGADPGAADGLCEELRAAGTRVSYLPLDLADAAAPQQVVSAAVETFGQVDILVANHARSSSQGLADLTARELDLSFAVNARATLLLVKAFAAQWVAPAQTGAATTPQPARGRSGRVVLFTSGQYHGAMPDELPYIASKAVAQQLTAPLAVELAAHAITVNCVNPGPNDTGYATGDGYRRVEELMPAGRWGTPEDAARLVGWLVSDEAGWVTGQTIASDGGWSARGSS